MSNNAMIVAQHASLTTPNVTVPNARGWHGCSGSRIGKPMLPVPYFHVVFTLPAPVGEIAFQNKAAVYAILFRVAAETLATIAADPRHLGAKLGMTMSTATSASNRQSRSSGHFLGRPAIAA
jgi:hypothetical protein